MAARQRGAVGPPLLRREGGKARTHGHALGASGPRRARVSPSLSVTLASAQLLGIKEAIGEGL